MTSFSHTKYMHRSSNVISLIWIVAPASSTSTNPHVCTYWQGLSSLCENRCAVSGWLFMEQFSLEMTSYKIGFRYSAHLLHQGAYMRECWTFSPFSFDEGNHVGVEKRPSHIRIHVCVMDLIYNVEYVILRSILAKCVTL